MIDLYGWRPALAHAFAPHAARGLVPGRIAVQQRGLYIAISEHGELAARVSGRLAHDAEDGGLPVVGDWVAMDARPGEGSATIQAVLPRRGVFLRRAAGAAQAEQAVAANIDAALLVASLNADLNLRRLERYLAAAWQSGARPVIVLTKADLCADPEAAAAEVEAVALGVPVLILSALSGQGLGGLVAEVRPGETCALLGSSGAGKSTLVNALAGEELMAVGAIREDDARGRHTTTHRELILLPSGALVLDTPGMRELGLIDADEGLDAAFAEIGALAERCRFRDCGHGSEPGCAVRQAVQDGRLDPARLRSFDKLRRELAHLERREDRLARKAEQKHWIAIHKAQRAGRKLRDKP